VHLRFGPVFLAALRVSLDALEFMMAALRFFGAGPARIKARAG
jgi:hypothetical protein